MGGLAKVFSTDDEMSSTLDDVPLMAWPDPRSVGCEVSVSTRENASSSDAKSERASGVEESERTLRYDDVLQSTCSDDEMTAEMESTVDEIPVELEGEEDAVAVNSDESPKDKATDASSSLQSSVQRASVDLSEPSSARSVTSEVQSYCHTENESAQKEGSNDRSSVAMLGLAEQILETEDDGIEIRAHPEHKNVGEAVVPDADVEDETIDASSVQESLRGVTFDLSIRSEQQHEATEALPVSDAEDGSLQKTDKDECISAQMVDEGLSEEITETEEHTVEIQACADGEEATDASLSDGSPYDGPIEWSKPQEQPCAVSEAQSCSQAENESLQNGGNDNGPSGEMTGVVEQISCERKDCVTEVQSHADLEDDSGTADRKATAEDDITDGPAILTSQDRALIPFSTPSVQQSAASETQSSSRVEEESLQDGSNDEKPSLLTTGPAEQMPETQGDAIEAQTCPVKVEDAEAVDLITNIEDEMTPETSGNVSLDEAASNLNHSSGHPPVASDASSSNDVEDVCLQEETDKETIALATGLAKQTPENSECVTEIQGDAAQQDGAEVADPVEDDGPPVLASLDVTALDSTTSSTQQCAGSEAPSSTHEENEPLPNQDNSKNTSGEMMAVAEQTPEGEECMTEVQGCPQQREDIGAVDSLEQIEDEVTDQPSSPAQLVGEPVDLNNLSAPQYPTSETDSSNRTGNESLQDGSNDEIPSPLMTSPDEQLPETEGDTIEVQMHPVEEEDAEVTGFVENTEEEDATDTFYMCHASPDTTADPNKQFTEHRLTSDAEFFSESDDQQEHLFEEEINIKRDRWLDTLACVERAEKSELVQEQSEKEEIERSEEKEPEPFTLEEDNSPPSGLSEHHSKDDHDDSGMVPDTEAPDETDENLIEAVAGSDAEEDLLLGHPTTPVSQLPIQQEETEKEELSEAVPARASLEKTQVQGTMPLLPRFLLSVLKPVCYCCRHKVRIQNSLWNSSRHTDLRRAMQPPCRSRNGLTKMFSA